MNIEALYKLYQQNPSVQTDTRKLKNGDIFFALKGPSFNGNHFAKQALDAGAVNVVLDEDPGFKDERIFMTDDVLTSLQQLAKHHRKQFAIPFIGITGSNGKTTTKELIHAVLSSTYRTYTTEGNLNNHIGIPLTILKVRSDAEIAVIEMGANHLFEIKGYCEYALPTHGLITNCGKAHLEGFGSVEGVRKAKGELYDHLRENKGTVFVNADDEVLMKMSEGIAEVKTYGNNGSIKGEIVHEADAFLKVKTSGDVSIKIATNLVGGYNLYNVLAAVAIGNYFKVDKEKIRTSIENYLPSNSRSQLIKLGPNSVILDAYNANPSSMNVAIENFASIPGANKTLIIGAMAELGEDSEIEHRAVISLIEKYKWDNVVLVGKGFKDLSAFTWFENSDEAANWFKNSGIKNGMILIKGSNSQKMEKVLL